jgi:hypothetical protein
MMHEHDRHVELSLEVTEVGEKLGDFCGAVFIPVVKTHKRIEKDNARPECLEGCEKPIAILAGVEPKARSGDDVKIQIPEAETSVPRESFRTLPERLEGIFGEVDERAALFLHPEAAEAGGTARYTHRHIERQKRFTHFWMASDQPHGASPPKTFYKPASGRFLAGNLPDLDYGQSGGFV